MQEIPLQFGNVNNATQVGNTVRRDTGSWTPTIHTLLNYLGDNRFDMAPKVLGVDDKSREILSFIAGEAASRPWPPILKNEYGLRQAAKLLRTYHDIVANFNPPDDAIWRVAKSHLKQGKIIRHGDLGPWNTIWHNDKLTGLIDWDFAQPGERIDDLAQMAYYFVPLRQESGWKNAGFTERPDLSDRLSVLVNAYGMYGNREVIDALLNLLINEIEIVKSNGKQGLQPWVFFLERGDVEERLADIAWLESVKSTLL